MNLVQNLVDEVRWQYLTGEINKINPTTVVEIAEKIYPNHPQDDTFNQLIFDAIMRL